MKLEFNEIEAQWFISHMKNFWNRTLAGPAPTGFPAYGRLLFPAETGSGLSIRWRAIAAINGTRLTRCSDFMHVALPKTVPPNQSAWDGYAPNSGLLNRSDAHHLRDILAEFTPSSTPMWYATWDGWSVGTALELVAGAAMSEEDVDTVPRIRIPGRDYVLFSGTLAEAPGHSGSPNYWWPHDHAWCVAGDVDLTWAVIAGSQALIERLASSPGLEVLPITTTDIIDPPPPWVIQWVDDALQQLMAHRLAHIATPRGTVNLSLDPARNWLSASAGVRGARTARSRVGPRRPDFESCLHSTILSHLLSCLDLHG